MFRDKQFYFGVILERVGLKLVILEKMAEKEIKKLNLEHYQNMNPKKE